MFKLIKYLKPFIVSVCIIVLLLLVQAMADLSLPDYTSNIVNVGIQQGGIEKAVPIAIRKSEFDKLIILMNQGEKVAVKENYILLDKNNLSSTDYAGYVKEYPKLVDEPIYKLNTNIRESIDKLNPIMGRAILILAGMKKNGQTADPFKMISRMSASQIEDIKKKINEKLSGMSASMITQSAVSYIHSEYKILGINTDKLQSNYILYIGGLMLLIALLSMAASVFVGYLASKVAAGLGKNLRKSLFGKVVSFSNAELDKFSTASLITRNTNDIQQVQMLMVMALRIVFYAPILGIGGIIKVFNNESSMSWIIAVAVISILILVVISFTVVIPAFTRIQNLVDRLNLVTREILTGIPVIRAFGTQKYEEEKFEKANIDITKTNLFVSRIMTLMMPLMILIMNGTTLLIIWVGAHEVDKGVLQVGNMMAFIQYAMQIIMAFLMISMVSIILPRASVAAERIDEVLKTELTVKDPQKASHLSTNSKGNIEFRNVSFRYPGAEENVFSEISFTAKFGETTAIIGSTGTGKTTLINLIPRFYDVTKGEILIDGIDIRKVKQHELRERIGYVPQKGVLFSGTIESNLSYGVKHASENELEKSAEIAQAIEFIKEKPEGFKTPISQGGINVSGGQKQRLSIARALTKKPKIFIFDDSFSALDFKTDAALRKALKGELGSCTVIIVAQRISTIMSADRIIVLEEGKIAGIGTHKELIEKCEVYQEIAYSQFSKEELA